MRKILHPSAVCLAAAVALAATWTACQDESFTFSTYRNNLTIDNSIHQDPVLAGAMNAFSKGIFCRITFSQKTGVKKFIFEDNHGNRSEKPFNAVDERLQSQNHLGMNNGLIVGFTTFGSSAPGTAAGGDAFVAYDNQCPDCFRYDELPLRNFPLSLHGNGMASCDNCRRKYDLNVVGNGLTRYRATTTGSHGILHVE